MHNFLILTIVFSLFIGISPVYAANSNLFVSAENPVFENYFSGSMVVEVVINDNLLNDLDESKGEPDVTLNGKSLRMVQATDGNWYAYFANVGKAKIADQTSFGGVPGEGLDFGVFCSRDTDASVLGVSFSDTDGVAIPRTSGISGFTNGESLFSECTGSLTASSNLNNVVRQPKSINTNSNVAPGQIGLNSNAWPIIQLFSFDDVVISYNRAGGAQTVNLEYDEIPNITIDTDRDAYPSNSEVFITISDIQLNQDPTEEDSWTFSVGSTSGSFYQAFTRSGSNSANGDSGLINLISELDKLGFEDNGIFSLTLDSIILLKTNDKQPSLTITDGTTTFSDIVTFVESSPNSGIFQTFDEGDESVVGILSNAPRGQSDTIRYNNHAVSILSGSSTAQLTTNEPTISTESNDSWRPGYEIPITVTDFDQNLNSEKRDHLDVFRSSSIIPTLQIGNPVTLENTSNVKFYESSNDSLLSGISIDSSIPDTNSAILHVDTSDSNIDFEMMSLDLGISSSKLVSILIDDTVDSGTNWINYDLRSFDKQLELDDLSDTSISLYFGSLSDSTPVKIVNVGDLTSFQGLKQISNDLIDDIQSKSGDVFLVVNFDASDNNSGIGIISDESDSQPIVFDIFSFGQKNTLDVNNSIYRFELEETNNDSGVFEGTLEYSMMNQLNISSPSFVNSIKTIDDDIRFIVTDRLLDDQGITISYSDLDSSGVVLPTSSKSSITTHSGIITTDSTSYGFGRPVTIILNDPDLNLNNDEVDIYTVINDPNSPNVDTVGSSTGNVLLEVKLKDTIYKRCVIDGVSYGGLGATGFSLVETNLTSGIFEGTFKMPSQICNKSGTALIYTSGGSIDVRYFDFRDSQGESNIFNLSNQKESQPYQTIPQLNEYVFDMSLSSSYDVILTGKIDGYARGIPLIITLISPDSTQQNFVVTPTSLGSYKAILSLDSNSLLGIYDVDLSYDDSLIGTTSFTVKGKTLSMSDNALAWVQNDLSDNSFRNDIKNLVKDSGDSPSDLEPNDLSKEFLPQWLKKTTTLWLNGQISFDEYVNALEFLVNKGIIRV